MGWLVGLLGGWFGSLVVLGDVCVWGGGCQERFGGR